MFGTEPLSLRGEEVKRGALSVFVFLFFDLYFIDIIIILESQNCIYQWTQKYTRKF